MMQGLYKMQNVKLQEVEFDGKPMYMVYNIWFEEHGPGLISENLVERKMELKDVGSKGNLTKKYPHALDIEYLVKKLADKGILK